MPTLNPRMSDDAVKSKTGKSWGEWFKLLDAAGARKMRHQEIVGVVNKHGAGPWWEQMVTVTYEQTRGLRAKHEKPGGYEISVSRIIDASVSKAFKAWTNEKTRKAWLPSNFRIRKATANKSLRLTWEDGQTSVTAAFIPKSSSKCQVVAQHSKLPDAKAAAKMKKFWAEALDRLKEFLE
jgi:uncharacterized protein YndB with AHSA1/START domain